MLSGLVDLLFPCLCPNCEQEPGPALCPACRDDLLPLVDACSACAAPAGRWSCANCHGKGLTHLASVSAGYAYLGVLRQLVHRAKVDARPAAVAMCAGLLPMPLLPAVAVVPIPPSPGRRPGPHLGTALAHRVARDRRLPLVHALATTRLAQEQHLLGVTDRARNVVDLFAIRRRIAGPVLLVDDLLTSGATASAAAAVLRAGGATAVHFVGLARTERRSQ